MRRHPRPGRPELLKFGNYIRKLRQQRGLYLDHIANSTGFSINYISEVERGIKPPNDELISALAKYFNIQEETLFFMAGKLPPSFTKEVIESESLQSLILQISQTQNLSDEEKEKRYRMLAEFLKKISDE